MNGFNADYAKAEVHVSPNFGARRDGLKPSILLLHYTGMVNGEAAEAWLCNPDSEVSCHYIIHENGRIVQMVREADRAWHAGAGSWQGNPDVNSASIGMEIVNPGHEIGYRDFPDTQINAVVHLCKSIVERNQILPEMVLAHSDTAPGRKVDPGEKFPWSKLHAAGVGHYVEPEPLIEDGKQMSNGDSGEAVERLQSMLSLYGYGLEITGAFDDRTKSVVEAFQRHFRPSRVDGIADPSTVLTLRRLLRALPDR